MAAWIAIGCIAVALFVIAHGSQRRIRASTDYFLAGRQLGPFTAALSQLGNAGLLWVLLTLASAAYRQGPAAVWSGLAVLAGYALSWYYLAPRLQALSIKQHSITVGQVFAADLGRRRHRAILGSLALILFVAVLLMTAARWQLAAEWAPFARPPRDALIAGATALVLCLMFGGYWAASLVEAVLTLLLVLLLVLLGGAALQAMPDWATTLMDAIRATPQDWFAGQTNVVALAFVLGVGSAALADCGQPAALTRFMAVRDGAALRRARGCALALMLGSIASGLMLGWCARVVAPELGNPDLLIPTITRQLLPAPAAAFFSVIVMAYLVLGVGSAWLCAISAWIVDLREPTAGGPTPLWLARAAVLVMGVSAALLVWHALTAALPPMQRMQLGWQLLGASLGPWLLVRLSGKRIRAGVTLGALWSGCVLTLIFHAMPDAPGDYLERVLPFIAALGIVLTGGEQRRDPDRADRETVPPPDRAGNSA